MKRLTGVSAYVLFVVVLVVTCLEITARVLETRASLYRYDRVEGWAMKGGLDRQKRVKTFKGKESKVSLRTDQEGMRRVGLLTTHGSEIKGREVSVMALGDSCTGGFYTDDKKTWPGWLSTFYGGKIKMYSYGIDGGSLLQSYLAFKRLHKIISPDILIVQFSPNDIHDGNLEYASYSFVRNQAWRRPYSSKDGNPVFVEGLKEKTYRYLHRSSALFKIIDSAAIAIEYRVRGKYSYEIMESEWRRLQDAGKSAYASDLKRLVNYARKAGVKEFITIACASEESSPEEISVWKETNKELGVQVVKEFGNVVFRKSKEGEDVLAADGAHFNALGNRIGARTIMRALDRAIARVQDRG